MEREIKTSLEYAFELGNIMLHCSLTWEAVVGMFCLPSQKMFRGDLDVGGDWDMWDSLE